MVFAAAVCETQPQQPTISLPSGRKSAKRNLLSRTFIEGIRRIGGIKEENEPKQDVIELQNRFPLAPQNVEAHGSSGLQVGVIHLETQQLHIISQER